MPEPEPVLGIEQAAKCNTGRNRIPLKLLIKSLPIETTEALTCTNPEEAFGILVNSIGKFIAKSFGYAKIEKLIGLC